MENCKQFIKEKKWSLIALAAAVILLVICGVLFKQDGIYYKDEFLRKRDEGCWQGKVLGEDLTITRSEGTDGITVRFATATEAREFLVTGEPGWDKQASLYEGEELLFTGRYHTGGFLENLEGDLHDVMGTTVSLDGEVFFQDANGELIPDSPLRVSGSQVMSLGFAPDETTRGSLLFVVMAAIVLIMFYVELWCPQLHFHWGVGRFVDGDAEPSDEYLARRTIGLIGTGLLFFVVLVMGFLN